MLEDEDLDVAAVTETWMISQNNNITAELASRGYGIYHFNRHVKKGGGVALIFKQVFKFISGKTYKYDSFECVQCSIATTQGRHLIFVIVYRHCEISPVIFLQEFFTFLERTFFTVNNFIVLGDFNVHVNNLNDPTTEKFYDILSSFDLKQHVDCCGPHA